MDIDCSAVNGAVPEPGFQRQKIQAVLITVCGIGMAQGVGREAAVHAKFFLMVKDDFLEPLFIHRLFYIVLLCKKPGFGAHMGRAGIPVIEDFAADTFGNGDIAVRVVFGNRNIEALPGKGNIAAFQVAQFIKP